MSHENLRFEKAENGEKIPPLQNYPTFFDYKEPKLLVISDIDDTILISKSEKFFSKLWLMLFRQTAKRNFVEESERAYRKLKNQSIPFAYVSASEQNLFATIANFLEYHDLPLGPVMLRPYTHWKEVFRAKKRENYKVDRIGKLASFFPDTKLVLFGDDSQQDPDAFKQMAERLNGRVEAIFIRKTGTGHNEEEIQKMKNNENWGKRVFHYSSYNEIEPQINQLIDAYSHRS